MPSLSFAAGEVLQQKAAVVAAKYAKLRSERAKLLAELDELTGEKLDPYADNAGKEGWFPFADLPPKGADFRYAYIGRATRSGTALQNGNAFLIVHKRENSDKGTKVIGDAKPIAILNYKSPVPLPGDPTPYLVGRFKPAEEPVIFEDQKITTYKEVDEPKRDKIKDMLAAYDKLGVEIRQTTNQGLDVVKNAQQADITPADRAKILAKLGDVGIDDKVLRLLTTRVKPIPGKTPVAELDNPPELPANDPEDPRPLIVRQFAQARQFAKEYSEKAKTNKALEAPAKQWTERAAKLRAEVTAAKTKAEKEEKAKFAKQAEETWPVPKGTPTIQRAKIEAKQTSWVNEQMKPILEKIAKEYSVD
ncbi:hypothetical protein [Zavarzinella formosa]|uniref:hypothetical protein n=1 Tax=Zavarzinella formosa TaxID=360055 RepID=UPI0012F88C6C|nr:hypothetical protein [Zavarzinella formosa]